MSPEERDADLQLSEPEQEESADEVNDSESDSDEEEEEDEEVDIGRHAKKKFDKIISDIKAGTLNLDDKATLDAFLQKYEDILGKRSIPKDQNLLHLLADAGKDELPYKKIKGLVEALIKTPWAEGDLLAQQDSDHKTPLYIAISLKHHRLAKLMCEAHPDIDRVIKIKPKGLGNSLHLALRNKKSSKDDELATILINSSSDETLCDKDESGLTPLHLAVDYKRCDDAQVGIVKAIVERCPATLDQTYEHKGKGLLSPYRYHELTYQEAMEKAAREPKRKTDNSEVNGQQSARSVKGLAPVRPRQQATAEPGTTQPPRRVPGKTELAPTGKFSSAAPKSAAVEGPKPGQLSKTKTEVGADGKTDSRNALDVNDNPASSAPATKSKSHKKESKTKTKSSSVKPTEESSRNMKKYLKLYYLRTKNHDDAIEFLYGVQQDRQIYFDLFGAGPTLSQSRMQDGLKHLEFEDILQYVAVPQVRIEGTPVTVKGNKPPPKPDAKGRSDLKLLFHWLKDDNQKKVKTILKVIVDDLQEPAHHDEAIEECLDGLGVEVWDWRKMDISPDVIKKVAPDAREVHLYWSGSNAVLRGWGEADTLRQLKKLERVYLHAHQGLETRLRNRQYTEAFKQRLERASERLEGNMKPIKVVVKKTTGDPGDASATGVDAVRDPYDRHRWIQTMEDFADFIQTAERNADPPVALAEPVLVAVIDDGVDINDASVQSRVIGGRSFCHRDEEENLNQPYYVSSSGHGTAMAGLICKLCPNVKLFVLKLDERQAAEAGKRSITAKSAAKAVRAAVDRNVDIISMSWTIERTETNKADIDELEKAIELAASKDMLMFCAATDQGAFKDRSYPAASGTKKIFKIGAAEASGAALKWIGDQSAVDFIMPGHQVVMERHGDPGVQKFTPLTGSSVATALAAGLAAIVLYCVQLGGIVRADGNEKEESRELAEYRALKTHERMKEAFQQIGTTKESEFKYVTVWNRFGKTVKKAETEMRDRWINLLADLAEDLKREE